jgi:nucleoid-associated protein YgaU
MSPTEATTGWDGGKASEVSSEALRDRWIDRTLEKILKYSRQPRTRPIDLAIVGIGLAGLLVGFVRGGGRTVDNGPALKDISARLERLEQSKVPAHVPTVIKTVAATVTATVTVTATTTLTPAMAEPVKPSGAPTHGVQVHVLEPGESLWSVCQKYYGDPGLLPALEKYNGISDPSGLHVGMSIKVPPVEALKAP